MTPAAVRAMTPEETALLVEAWNAAQEGGGPEAPTAEEFEDLVRRYG